EKSWTQRPLEVIGQVTAVVEAVRASDCEEEGTTKRKVLEVVRVGVGGWFAQPFAVAGGLPRGCGVVARLWWRTWGCRRCTHEETTLPALRDCRAAREVWRQVGGPASSKYFVLLKLEVILQNRESGGDVMSLFHKVMKDAGCSESQITPPHTSYNFFARLTEEEANKLAGLDSVKKVRPKVNSRWFSEFL
uniref:Uncharacterized protein n=1 Tax=Chenopodium quinoa TaxID=63459 RepID=A0A803LRS3_CHEQI